MTWNHSKEMEHLFPMVSSYYSKPHKGVLLFLKCVTEIRRCQIRAPDITMNNIDGCLSIMKSSHCLKQNLVRSSCSYENDTVFLAQLKDLYDDMYDNEHCLKSIECARTGIYCWHKTLQSVRKFSDEDKFPLSLYFLVDISSIHDPKIFSPEMIDDPEINRSVCS